MRTTLQLSIVLTATFAAVAVIAVEPPRSLSLGDAVIEFNRKAQLDEIGKDQPPLTEDEVVAAIRGWIREQMPATDAVYDAFQRVATTKQLPPTAKLHFTTDWHGFKGMHFDVWWIDLTLTEGSKHGYTYRLRDRKIRCRPVEAADDVLIVPTRQNDETE